MFKTNISYKVFPLFHFVITGIFYVIMYVYTQVIHRIVVSLERKLVIVHVVIPDKNEHKAMQRHLSKTSTQPCSVL